jgi:hypothetical protein
MRILGCFDSKLCDMRKGPDASGSAFQHSLSAVLLGKASLTIFNVISKILRSNLPPIYL